MALPAITIYKLKSPKFTGAIYARYKDGVFAALDGDDAQLTPEQWSYLLRTVPVRDANWGQAELGTLQATLVVPKSVKDKLVAFCAAYRSYRKVPYQPKLLEKANLKDVVVSDDLLKVFFESPLQNFTLKNYIDRINITRDQARNGRVGTSHFPNVWEPAFFKSLHDPQVIMAYQAHLRELGWRKDKTRDVWHPPGSDN